jgi:DNA mismatch repair ATPase MutS
MAHDEAVHDAINAVADERAEVLSRFSAEVKPYSPEVILVNSFATAIATLNDHASACSAWQPVHSSVASDGIVLHGLFPYWINDGVTNDVYMNMDHPIVLTGSNGGGKSTLLRSIAAACLLARIGLAVPCRGRVNVPELTNIFLRMGSADCASERRGSFANEMCDVATILNSPGPNLVLIDEPCRGTATKDAENLVSSIVDSVADSHFAVFATHFHDLGCERGKKMQLEVTSDSGTCRPSFRLVSGVCTQSLALHVALSAGVPLSIVKSATSSDDAETIVLHTYASLGIPNVNRIAREATLPPLTGQAVLYALFTTAGIYVGETDDFAQRLESHKRSKTFDFGFYAIVRDKSLSRTLEARLQTELKFANVTLASVTDSCHRR